MSLHGALNRHITVYLRSGGVALACSPRWRRGGITFTYYAYEHSNPVPMGFDEFEHIASNDLTPEAAMAYLRGRPHPIRELLA